jgi:hypothetical protein
VWRQVATATRRLSGERTQPQPVPPAAGPARSTAKVDGSSRTSREPWRPDTIPVGYRVARGGECSGRRGMLVLPPYALKATRRTATPAPAATAKRRISVLKLRSPAFSRLPLDPPDLCRIRGRRRGSLLRQVFRNDPELGVEAYVLIPR